ncbi:diguanylate cyclase domain-containing protein [Roseateles cavernae]|uniref:diguanylate cyclase domain-containing protein n=1 Tax=Roseateles cavernae TaxID=3153578 RepID=UPI003D80BF95
MPWRAPTHGDELVLVQVDVVDGEWKAAVNRGIASVSEPVTLTSGLVITLGVTAGVALSAPDDEVSPHELIQLADHIMLAGKRSGMGRAFMREPGTPAAAPVAS